MVTLSRVWKNVLAMEEKKWLVCSNSLSILIPGSMIKRTVTQEGAGHMLTNRKRNLCKTKCKLLFVPRRQGHFGRQSVLLSWLVVFLTRVALPFPIYALISWKMVMQSAVTASHLHMTCNAITTYYAAGWQQVVGKLGYNRSAWELWSIMMRNLFCNFFHFFCKHID